MEKQVLQGLLKNIPRVAVSPVPAIPNCSLYIHMQLTTTWDVHVCVSESRSGHRGRGAHVSSQEAVRRDCQNPFLLNSQDMCAILPKIFANTHIFKNVMQFLEEGSGLDNC